MNDKPITASINPDQLTAYTRLKKAAERGNAEAQFELGRIYGNGEGVPQDYPTAIDWLVKAAEQDHAKAQESLGSIYANGVGVKQDFSTARHWYIKAAHNGLGSAQYLMATMYRFGLFESEVDMDQAIDWYHKAANQNVAAAQLALGKLAMRGKHVKQDESAALQWLMLAHANGSKGADTYIQQLMERMPTEALEALRVSMTKPSDTLQ
ncbi:MAG: tetratricopeptide repeat protein [Gammaproteobacteria bacterium]|nr:tetratricopeptide repeat protein [Gammaproteobacteria bacterium]